MIRPQYHFRPSANGYFAWDIRRLIRLAEAVPVSTVLLDDIAELDEPYWFQGFNGPPTTRAIAEHARLIQEADLQWPILLCAEGRLMDGMHRTAKAMLAGATHISAKRFPHTPPPDFTDIHPDDLPY